MGYIVWWARLLYLAGSRLRLCSANHRPGYLSNLPCDWPNAAWAYSKQETENGLKFSWRAIFDITACVILPSSCDHIAYECHILQVLKTNYQKYIPTELCTFLWDMLLYTFEHSPFPCVRCRPWSTRMPPPCVNQIIADFGIKRTPSPLP